MAFIDSENDILYSIPLVIKLFLLLQKQTPSMSSISNVNCDNVSCNSKLFSNNVYISNTRPKGNFVRESSPDSTFETNVTLKRRHFLDSCSDSDAEFNVKLKRRRRIESSPENIVTSNEEIHKKGYSESIICEQDAMVGIVCLLIYWIDKNINDYSRM